LPVIVTSQGRDKVSPADLLSFCVERHGGLEALAIGDSNEALAELLFSSVRVFVKCWGRGNFRRPPFAF
jgi:hypothetical protein